MIQTNSPSPLPQAARPSFVGAYGLLTLHLFSYGTIVALFVFEVSGNAVFLYLLTLVLLSLTCLGAGLGLLARRLTEWHLASLPEQDAPTAPTAAQHLIAAWIDLTKTGLLVCAAGCLGFVLTGQTAIVIVLAPIILGLCAAWYILSGIVRTPGLSRSQTLHRAAVAQEMPRIRRARGRQHRATENFTRFILVVGPLAVLHWIVAELAPDSSLLALVKLAGLIATLGVVIWPNTRLPRYLPDIASGVRSKVADMRGRP